jgi:hypothetical protein
LLPISPDCTDLLPKIPIFSGTFGSAATDLDFPPNSEISSGGFNFQLQFRFSAGTSGVPPTIWIFRPKIPIFGGTFETPAELLIFRGLRFFAACSPLCAVGEMGNM